MAASCAQTKMHGAARAQADYREDDKLRRFCLVSRILIGNRHPKSADLAQPFHSPSAVFYTRYYNLLKRPSATISLCLRDRATGATAAMVGTFAEFILKGPDGV